MFDSASVDRGPALPWGGERPNSGIYAVAVMLAIPALLLLDSLLGW